jgi:hypothetical protein
MSNDIRCFLAAHHALAFQSFTATLSLPVALIPNNLSMAQVMCARRLQFQAPSTVRRTRGAALYAVASVSAGKNSRPTEAAPALKLESDSQLHSGKPHQSDVEPIVWLRPFTQWFQPSSTHEEEW